MSGSGRWLAGARAADDGLLLPGVPAGRSCDLLLGAGQVLVRADEEVAELSWDHISDEDVRGATSIDAFDRGDLTSAVSGGDAWRLGYWAQTQYGPVGAGLHVSGACARAVEPVSRARSSFRNRWDRLLTPGTVLPLHAPTVKTSPESDVRTLRVLFSALARRPDWRTRLDEPDRIRQLLADLTEHRYRPIFCGSGVRQRTFEIRRAMQKLGYVHEWAGRPLPNELMPGPEEVVAAVLARVRSDRHSAVTDVAEEDVRAQVAQEYTDVEPWPFAALAD